MFKYSVLISLILFAFLSSFAQSTIEVEKYTTKDGLSSNFIYRVYQDRQGFLWIATIDGLNRFDGKEFKIYRNLTNDTLSISGNNVLNVDEDTEGNLWILTTNGLCKYIRSKNHFIPFHFPWIDKVEKQYSTEPALKVVGDSVWFTDYEGINLINARTHQVQRFFLPEPYKGRHLISLGIDQEKRMYAGSTEGLFILNPVKGMFERSELPLPNSTPLSYYIDSKNSFWITMWAEGALNISMPSGKFLQYGKYVSPYKIFETGSDSFIACGDYQGLLSFHRGSNEMTPVNLVRKETGEEENMNINHIACFDPDLVWFCGTDGLLKWDRKPKKIRHVKFKSNRIKEPYTINSMLQDPVNKNELWINIWLNNLLLYDFNTGEETYFFDQNHKPLTSLPFGFYNGLCKGKDGNVLISGQFGVWQYDRVKKDFIKVKPLNHVNSLIEQSCSRLYKLRNEHILAIVIGKGLVEFSDDLNYYKEYPFNFKELNERDLRIISLTELNDHTLILCSPKTGLYLLDRNTGVYSRITQDKTGREFPSNLSVLERDHKGNIWIGTTDRVMILDSNLTFIKYYGTENGLVSNQIQNIKKDKRNAMWVSTLNGLSILEPESNNFKSLTSREGLLNNESYTIGELSSNQIIVGHTNGLSVIDRSRNFNQAQDVRLHFTEIKVQDKEYSPFSTTLLNLSNGEGPVQVKFNVIDFHNAENVTYFYKLEGASGNWRPLASTAQLSFYELPPGDYKLIISAVNSSGIRTRKPLELAIKVAPPYYATWWFRLAIVALISSVVYLIFRIRRQKQREMESIRERISRDLHDDIGSTLSSINILTSSAKKRLKESDKESLSDSLERIGSRTGRLLDNMNDIIWSVKPDNDTLDKILARMREYASNILEAKKIKFEINFPEENKEETLTLDVKNNLYMIFKEAVNNCAKYSECTFVKITLRYDKNQLDLQISDNGKGFDPDSGEKTDQFGGNGLHNMRKRAAEIGGKLTIQSKPNQGTTIHFMK